METSSNSSVEIVRALRDKRVQAGVDSAAAALAAHKAMCEERQAFWAPTLRELRAVADEFKSQLRVTGEPGAGWGHLPGFILSAFGSRHYLLERTETGVLLVTGNGSTAWAQAPTPEELLPKLLTLIAEHMK